MSDEFFWEIYSVNEFLSSDTYVFASKKINHEFDRLLRDGTLELDSKTTGLPSRLTSEISSRWKFLTWCDSPIVKPALPSFSGSYYTATT